MDSSANRRVRVVILASLVAVIVALGSALAWNMTHPELAATAGTSEPITYTAAPTPPPTPVATPKYAAMSDADYLGPSTSVVGETERELAAWFCSERGRGSPESSLLQSLVTRVESRNADLESTLNAVQRLCPELLAG